MIQSHVCDRGKVTVQKRTINVPKIEYFTRMLRAQIKVYRYENIYGVYFFKTMVYVDPTFSFEGLMYIDLFLYKSVSRSVHFHMSVASLVRLCQLELAGKSFSDFICLYNYAPTY